MNDRTNAGLWPWTHALFTLALLCAALGMISGAISYAKETRVAVASQSAPARRPPSTAVVTDLEQRLTILNVKLDAADKNFQRNSQLIQLLLVVTSLYAFALGLNSYFSLRQILDGAKDDSKRAADSAKESINNAKGDLEAFRDSIRSRYPEFSNLQGNLEDLLASTRLVLGLDKDWAEYSYSTLSEEHRQQFLIAEARVAGLEVFRLGSLSTYSDDVRSIYRALGRFYSSKFRSDRDRANWWRGSVYFDAAREAKRQPSADLLSDIGVHYLQVDLSSRNDEKRTPEQILEIESLRDKAEHLLQLSLDLDHDEPRALFNLAWLVARKGDYAKATALSKRLTAKTTWRPGERKKYLCWTLFNCACYQLHAPDLTDNILEAAFSLLAESRRVATEDGILETWLARARTDGDLDRLRSASPDRLAGLLA